MVCAGLRAVRRSIWSGLRQKCKKPEIIRLFIENLLRRFVCPTSLGLSWALRALVELRLCFLFYPTLLFVALLLRLQVLITLLTLLTCRIPDDHISIRSWKLAAAREVLATLLTSLGVSKP